FCRRGRPLPNADTDGVGAQDLSPTPRQQGPCRGFRPILAGRRLKGAAAFTSSWGRHHWRSVVVPAADRARPTATTDVKTLVPPGTPPPVWITSACQEG